MSDIQQQEQCAAAGPSCIASSAKAVIMSPTQFYRSMPKSGGFRDPLIFSVVVGVATGLVHAILLAAGLKPGLGLAMAVASIVITPIMVAIFGFVGAALFWLTWKILGSSESYETAYRCGAYASAIAPLTAVLGIIPFLGGPAGTVWMAIVLIAASIEVHKIPPMKAKVAFGGFAAFFCLLSISGQVASRAMKGKMAEFAAQNQQQIGDLAKQMEAAQSQMTPEQKQAMQAVMQQLQQAAQQDAKQ